MKSKRKPSDRNIGLGELNIAPLIDCIFLLLIFFMVTTAFIEVKGLVVDLPGAGEEAQEQEQQQKKDVTIQVTARGEYIVSGEQIAASELASAIRTAMELANNKNIIIYGDPEAFHKEVVYVMDMAQGQGVVGMAFAVEQKEGGE